MIHQTPDPNDTPFPILRMEWILPNGERYSQEQEVSMEEFKDAFTARPLPGRAGVEPGQHDPIKAINRERARLIQTLAPAFVRFMESALGKHDFGR